MIVTNTIMYYIIILCIVFDWHFYKKLRNYCNQCEVIDITIYLKNVGVRYDLYY